MALATWWTTDPLMDLTPLSNLQVRLSTDDARLATINQLTVAEVAQRRRAGHRPYVGYMDDTAVTYGWVAMRAASIGELDLNFEISSDDRYLWDFATLPDWQGQGLYPRLLQAILEQESKNTTRFWIIHAPENLPSGAGMNKAGFEFVGQLSFTSDGRANFTLRPHQQRSFDFFTQNGAMSLFVYPQTGKSFVGLKAIDVLIGRKVIFVPRVSLIDHWRLMIEFYLGEEMLKEVDLVTYQGARRVLRNKYIFALYDEAHHMPADFAIGTATDLQTETRMGLSATPKRQDGNEDLIVALCGPVSGGDWPVKATQKPTVVVWIVKNDKEKLDLAAQLCESPIDGKIVLFSWRLEIGRQAAERLGVPFIYSKTKRQLDIVRDNDTIVVSSVGNEGWSFPIRRAIELSFLYGSEMEAGQRAGRLAYEVVGQSKPGEHHLLMTHDEFERYRKRLTIYYEWGLACHCATPSKRFG